MLPVSTEPPVDEPLRGGEEGPPPSPPCRTEGEPRLPKSLWPGGGAGRQGGRLYQGHQWGRPHSPPPPKPGSCLSCEGHRRKPC